MPAERRKHFAVEALSIEGQAVVRRGLDENKTLQTIQRELEGATGEKIALSSLSRFAAAERMRLRLERQEQARDLLVSAVQANPDGRVAKMVSLLIEEALVAKGLDFSGKDGDELLQLLRQQQKLELMHQKVEADTTNAKAAMIRAIASEKHAEASLTQADAAMKRAELAERKLKQAEEGLRQAESEARKAGGTLTADQVRDMRAEFFGIVEEEEQTGGA